jgi:hypothetical protein
MNNGYLPSAPAFDANLPRSSFLFLPPDMERRIAERWKIWVPWVRVHLLRRGDCDPGMESAEFNRLRNRHTDRLLALFQARVPMRQIRRHRLDDPRISDDLHAILVAAAIARCRKANLARHRASGLEDSLNQPAATDDSRRRARTLFLPDGTTSAIEVIRKRVGEQFHLHEFRDHDLTLRSNRQIITFPRQLAMYFARELTAASLVEIGRQFGGMHHTTVLHSINKIAVQRRSDKDLDRTLTQLLDILQQK